MLLKSPSLDAVRTRKENAADNLCLICHCEHLGGHGLLYLFESVVFDMFLPTAVELSRLGFAAQAARLFILVCVFCFLRTAASKKSSDSFVKASRHKLCFAGNIDGLQLIGFCSY